MAEPVPFPASSFSGLSGQESAGRLVNALMSQNPPSAAKQTIWRRVAGAPLSVLITNPDETVIGARGFVLIGNVLLHFPAGQCYSVIESGGNLSPTLLGALEGTAPLTFAQNNKTPTPETVCITENGAFELFPGAPPAPLNEPNLVSSSSCCSFDGYHVYLSPGGRITASNFNDKTIGAESFVDMPEGTGVRVLPFNGELFAFGRDFFRVYRNVGATPFPFQYSTVKRDVGLAGTWAVAGFENGFPNSLIFVGSDNVIYRMDGYSPVKVGTEDIHRLIERSDRSQLRASVYTAEGQPFFTLTSPGDWTWEYNYNTGLWHERQSYQQDDWRGRSSIFAFDRWLIGDALTPSLFELTAEFPFEFQQSLVWTLESGILHKYPNRINAPWTWFRFTGAPGLDRGLIPTQTEPRVKISWSTDGGATFGLPLERELGSQGDWDIEVRIGNTGVTNRKGLQYRLEISDGVNIGFMGGEAEVEVRAA